VRAHFQQKSKSFFTQYTRQINVKKINNNNIRTHAW
jgi:hypothetical protein